MYINNHMWLTVPKNEKGYDEFNYGVEHTENMDEFKLSPDECQKLNKAGVFNILENTYEELYIDDFESNTITAEQLKAVYNDINVVDGVFIKAVDLAIKYGTCVYLDF